MDAGAECREQRQYIRCHRRSLSPGLFVVGFAHCMDSRTLYGPVYQTPGPLRTVRESLLPLSALLSPLSLSHCSPCAPRCRCALLPVRGGRRERACGYSVSRQPCWQGWQRIPGWWREGLAFLPAEQGPSEIAVQGIKGSSGLPLWPHAAVIRAAEVSRRGLCCQAFSCSCSSPFAFCPLLCLCGLFWRSVLHPCLDLSADLHVPAANCLAYAPPFPSVRMQRTAQRV